MMLWLAVLGLAGAVYWLYRQDHGKFVLKYRKVNPDTPDLKRAYGGGEVGFDVYAMECIKRDKGTEFWDTGIQIQPPPGFYFDLIPRSSIAKLGGWHMVNSVGVIDPTYRGNLLMALRKDAEDNDDVIAPGTKIGQIVPRRHYQFCAEQRPYLTSTVRGSGGFGSTG